MDNIYGLNFSIKSLAVANEFVTTLNKVCYKLGQNMQPFCLYGNDTQKQYGVIDFANFNGIAGQGTLLDEITEYRKGVFQNAGIRVDTSDDIKKKLLFFDYLMTISVCYVEIPKYTTRDGMAMATFDKFLCTRNPALMGTWMGETASVMQAKYSARIQSSQLDFNDNQLRVVKLNQSQKGNTITMPRTSYSVEDMTCIPLFMLYIFIEGFKKNLEDGIIEFSFLKDNGTVRVLPSTLNKDILMDYYQDNMFVGTMLNGVDINTVQQGALLLSSKMNRGYIKIPELGASIYDDTGVRSLNVARILQLRKVDAVDRSFIKVDLNSVIMNFKDSVEYAQTHIPDAIYQIYKDVTGKDASFESDGALIADLFQDVDSKGVFLSTTFFRQLHLYMVQNPTLFPMYTGTPNKQVTSSANYGIETMDFM